MVYFGVQKVKKQSTGKGKDDREAQRKRRFKKKKQTNKRSEEFVWLNFLKFVSIWRRRKFYYCL